MKIRNAGGLVAVAVTAVITLAACSGGQPKTPELSQDVVDIVLTAPSCSSLDDNLARAKEAQARETSRPWGEQYEALILWRRDQLGCE